ncbi:hypothetical protein JCM3774_000453, partial [Rhodotorula dairenensis]
QLADIQNALSPLPPLVPLSAMCVQQLLPKSLACILKRKFEDDDTTCAQILAFLDVEEHKRKRKRSRRTRTQKRGPRNAKFQHGFYGPVHFERPPKRTLEQLHRRYKLRVAGITIPERIEEIVAPFFNKPYFRALVVVTKNAQKDRDAIMTPDNAAQGIVANLTGGTGPVSSLDRGRHQGAPVPCLPSIAAGTRGHRSRVFPPPVRFATIPWAALSGVMIASRSFCAFLVTTTRARKYGLLKKGATISSMRSGIVIPATRSL